MAAKERFEEVLAYNERLSKVCLGERQALLSSAQASSTEALKAAFASGERHAMQASAEEKELSLAVAFKIKYDGNLCRISIPEDVFTYEAL